ncbi:MAG: extracellular solute-binding protein [Clostridiaceae bacterium]|nr:extracellular solute-binding protein [Clostridiaceae bacterium]
MGKKGFVILAAVFSLGAACLGGCSESEDGEIVLRVANWEEYIDEGDWDEDEEIVLENGASILGEQSLVEEFETWYYEQYHQRVRVEYSTFGTNEDLYNQLTLGSTFDLVCPSEYMAMKLMSEGELLAYSDEFQDETEENNYYAAGVSPYIRERLYQEEIDGEVLGDYIAGYMWGTLGFVYNPDRITQEEAADWNLLRNETYYRRVTAKDSVRDCYFAALGMLSQETVCTSSFVGQADYSTKLSEVFNDTADGTIEQVGEILKEVKDNVYSFETDSGKADMVTGKVYANLQWSGDAVYSIQQAQEDGITLKYAVPESATNLWFDGWCMLRAGIGEDSQKKQAAEAFVNFLSRPDNVIRNMYYIGYTSVIAGGDQDTSIYDYLRYNCECTDETADTTEYALGYFFSGKEEDERYILTADKEMLTGELSAMYPLKEVLDRSVVMAYYPLDVNQKINQMWIHVRCYHLGD